MIYIPQDDYLLSPSEAEATAEFVRLQAESASETIKRLEAENAELRLEVKMLCWTLARRL